MRNAKSFDLLLVGSGRIHGYVGLSEVEIYAGGANIYDRYVCFTNNKLYKSNITKTYLYNFDPLNSTFIL